MHDVTLCRSNSARFFRLKTKRWYILIWSVYHWHSSVCWLVFSPSSRWPETTSLWDILGSCGIGHSHSSGHSCCPGSYSASEKKEGNAVWVRKVLLVLLRDIFAFSSSVVFGLIILQKHLWFEYNHAYCLSHPFLPSSHAFGSVVGRGDPAVHFRAARSFNREGPELIEATCK